MVCKSRPELNSRYGVVEQCVPESQRFQILFDPYCDADAHATPLRLSVKASKLRPCDTQHAAAAEQSDDGTDDRELQLVDWELGQLVQQALEQRTKDDAAAKVKPIPRLTGAAASKLLFLPEADEDDAAAAEGLMALDSELLAARELLTQEHCACENCERRLDLIRSLRKQLKQLKSMEVIRAKKLRQEHLDEQQQQKLDKMSDIQATVATEYEVYTTLTCLGKQLRDDACSVRHKDSPEKRLPPAQTAFFRLRAQIDTQTERVRGLKAARGGKGPKDRNVVLGAITELNALKAQLPEGHPLRPASVVSACGDPSHCTDSAMDDLAAEENTAELLQQIATQSERVKALKSSHACPHSVKAAVEKLVALKQRCSPSYVLPASATRKCRGKEQTGDRSKDSRAAGNSSQAGGCQSCGRKQAEQARDAAEAELASSRLQIEQLQAEALRSMQLDNLQSTALENCQQELSSARAELQQLRQLHAECAVAAKAESRSGDKSPRALSCVVGSAGPVVRVTAEQLRY